MLTPVLRRQTSIQKAIMRGSMTATNMQPQIDEQTARTAWRAFGSYIAKTLVNGKGVLVPKFGIFTFGPVSVDLAGTTNPQSRDK